MNRQARTHRMPADVWIDCGEVTHEQAARIAVINDAVIGTTHVITRDEDTPDVMFSAVVTSYVAHKVQLLRHDD